MKKLIIFLILHLVGCSQSSPDYPKLWPMYNDVNVDLSVSQPSNEINNGPLVLFDSAHNNFFIQSHLIKPLVDLLIYDGYRVGFLDEPFSKKNLSQAKIVVIITALPFNFTTQLSADGKETFSEDELKQLQKWVNDGGSMLVFSEHAPFDQAINPLLEKFDIKSSIGATIDTVNYDKMFTPGMIIFEKENLNTNHPIVEGKYPVKKLVSFGGSSLTGDSYTNVLILGNSSYTIKHQTGIGPEGRGNSQGLAGNYGNGKVAAFGDSNGFTAMIFNMGEGNKMYAGMNTPGYDWKNFVLNTFHWLSN